jgi:hypothetical protein
MEFLVPILFMAVFVGIFAWIIVTQTRAQKARDAAIDALAADRGWRVTRRVEGRRKVAEIAPEGGGWVLKLASGYASSSGRNRSSAPGFAEFRALEPAWPGGRAVFAQRLPAAFEGRIGGTGLVGFFQNAAVKTMLSRVIDPAIVADLGRLKPFDPPPGIELMILATEDPREGNLRAIHEAVNGWRPRVGRDQGAPAVTIGPEGTSLRLPGELTSAEDVGAFADLGLRLAQALR